MFLSVRDFRLGGYLKPVVASGIVKLDEKIPDSPNYKPPGSEMYMCPEESALAARNETQNKETGGVGDGNIDGDSAEDIMRRASLLPPTEQTVLDDPTVLPVNKTAKGVQTKRDKMAEELKGDDLIGTLEPLNAHSFISERQAMEDTGAGIFGALQHVDLTAIEEMRARRGYDIDEDDDLADEDNAEPEWKKDRAVLENDLEKEFETTPFETYKLWRGKKNSIMGLKQVI